MAAWQERLDALRLRVEQVAAECDRKYSSPRIQTNRVEDALLGVEVETPFGRHLESEKLYPSRQHHGSADIGALSDLPADLLGSLSSGTIPVAPPEQWAFLDTETTGLSGSDTSGTLRASCAFLVGVGRITREGFRVRQFFMRHLGEEASLLHALSRHLEPFPVMITYNGKSFDQPLLEARYRWNRAHAPFGTLTHLDLLHGARRLWKLRFDSCRLVDLESQVLGFEREGDIPGALIPYVYYEYARTAQAFRMLPVFEHNALDILTLACLTAIVPHAFNEPFNDPSNGGLRHGSEMTGLARWLRAAGDFEGARTLLRRAFKTSDTPVPEPLLFHVMWDLAQLERKLDAREEALGLWEELASLSFSNPFQVRAIEELAKHHEHHSKDREKALTWTRAARAIEDSPELERREARLSRTRKTGTKRAKRKVGTPRAKRDLNATEDLRGA